jgi:hypothetical protein
VRLSALAGRRPPGAAISFDVLRKYGNYMDA